MSSALPEKHPPTQLPPRPRLDRYYAKMASTNRFTSVRTKRWVAVAALSLPTLGLAVFAYKDAYREERIPEPQSGGIVATAYGELNGTPQFWIDSEVSESEDTLGHRVNLAYRMPADAGSTIQIQYALFGGMSSANIQCEPDVVADDITTTVSKLEGALQTGIAAMAEVRYSETFSGLDPTPGSVMNTMTAMGDTPVRLLTIETTATETGINGSLSGTEKSTWCNFSNTGFYEVDNRTVRRSWAAVATSPTAYVSSRSHEPFASHSFKLISNRNYTVNRSLSEPDSSPDGVLNWQIQNPTKAQTVGDYSVKVLPGINASLHNPSDAWKQEALILFLGVLLGTLTTLLVEALLH